MSRTHHQRLQELFVAAVDLPEEERADFLRELTAENPALAREVEELLAADATATEGPPWIGGPAAPALVQGKGTYRVLRELGRGGMGVVYLAERSDGAFRRRVAIKVLRAHPGSDSELAQRFRSERQILAGLDHPFIASLLDAGALADGSPFLVMELVDGVPIDRFAEDRDLSVKARLELFVAVCDAVQAAHQSLVVHRDLKPSNVLVTQDGTPRLLDFGIAKLLDQGSVDWTVAETRLGRQPMTPRYASPEQLTGGPITTATDVYALGVLLYELLTGCPPYRPRSSAAHHWMEAVCEQEPKRPSTAIFEGDPKTGPGRVPDGRRELQRSLAGDLDHIVLMALRKEPSERYATAAELAADLRRHLDGRPIRARRPTLSYLAAKFLRRHRWGVAAAVAVVLLVSAFTIGLVRQLHRTEVERDKAQTVTDLLVGIFGVAGPSTAEDRDPTARDILDRGLESVEGSLDHQPEVKAALLDAIGRVYNNLGQLDQAARAHERAVELRRPLRRTAPLQYAESLSRLALVLVAVSDLERAETMYREALAVTTAEVGEEDSRTISHLDGLQQVLSKAGRHAEAEPLAQEVVKRTLRRLGFSDPEAAVASDSTEPELVAIATTLGSLAAEQRQVGRYAAAEKSLRQSLALNRRLLGEDHYGVAFNLNNLANVHSNQEDHATAVTVRGEALRLAEAVFGPDHPSVGSMRLNQGFDLFLLGRCSEALEEIDRAKGVFVAALGPDHPAVAIALSYQGLAERGLGRFEEALVVEREAFAALRQSLGENHPDTAQSQEALGDILLSLRRAGEAAGHYRQAAASYEQALGREHPDTLDCRRRLAGALLDSGQPEPARQLLETVLAALEQRDDLPRLLARTRFRLAQAQSPVPPPSPGSRQLAEEALLSFQSLGENDAAAAVREWLGRPSPQPP